MAEHSAASEPEIARRLRAAPSTDTGPAQPPRWTLLVCATLAGLAWAATLALLIWADLAVYGPAFSAVRLLFYGCVLLASTMTFVPLQWLIQLPGLAVKGVLGYGLLLYTLAFVPPPTSPVFFLPDAPVYALLALSLLLAVSAAVLPLIYSLGRLVFRQRARQYDLRRARRQAHGAGVLVALCALLAGLRVFTPLSAALLVGILVVVEVLFLAFSPVEAA